MKLVNFNVYDVLKPVNLDDAPVSLDDRTLDNYVIDKNSNVYEIPKHGKVKIDANYWEDSYYVYDWATERVDIVDVDTGKVKLSAHLDKHEFIDNPRILEEGVFSGHEWWDVPEITTDTGFTYWDH